MITLIHHLQCKLQTFLSREEGQDLVEYSLVVSLMAFGSISSMGMVASGVNNAFSSVALVLTTNV
jgi:Flp pilus assembly pilin Flp